MDKQDVLEEVQRLKQVLTNGVNNEELILSVENLKDLCIKLIPVAEASSFGGVRANGMWTFVKIVVKFFKLMDEKSVRTKTTTFIDMCKLLAEIIESFFHAIQLKHVQLKESEDVVDFFKPCWNERFHLTLETYGWNRFSHYYQDTERLEARIAFDVDYHSFWLDQEARRAITMRRWLTAVLEKPFVVPFKYLFDQSLRPHRCESKALCLSLIRQSNRFLGMGEFVLRWLFSDKDLRHRVIHVTSHNPYVFDEHGCNIEITRKSRKSRSIKCLVSSEIYAEKHAVLLYLHGGGYLYGSSHLDQGIFVNDWCKSAACSYIISVDYTLLRKYPVALQDVLDVYMWLTTEEEEVKNLLGFVPKKIVCAGDSAGGGLALSLTLALRDIEKQHKAKICHPSSLVLIYGFFNCTADFKPSNNMSVIDGIVTLPSSLQIFLMLSGWFELKEETGKLDIGEWLLDKLRWLFGKSRNMLQEGDIHRAFAHIGNTLRARYATPVRCKDLFEIRIPLFLVSAEFCPLLDDSVALAKAWKGPVTLDVMDDLPHAFLHLSKVCKKASQGKELCARRLKEACAS